MILMGDRFTIRFLMSGLPVERVKFGFLKDYAIRGIRFLAVLYRDATSSASQLSLLHASS